MSKKRILITYCSNTCHAHRVQVDPFDEQPGTYCDQSGRYVKITDEECAKCKHPILTGIAHSEAVEIVAEMLHSFTYPSRKWDTKAKPGHKAIYRQRARRLLNRLIARGSK